jgi:hypothetical protein
MIALFTFTPKYCPNCGETTHLKDPLSMFEKSVGMLSRDADYQAGASHKCKCGVSYQQVRPQDAIQCAAKFPGGDLDQYE